MNIRSSLVLVSALVLASGAVTAGPLNPPAGAVGPTLKTLGEVEPRTAINATNTPGDTDSVFKITQPGSYYLTGNVIGVFGKRGIEINASNVTIDLAGFSLLGVTGSLDGISVTGGGQTSITVMNGTARSWSGDGIDLEGSGTSQVRVERIVSLNNAAAGIRSGPKSTVIGCSATGNGGYGFDGYATSTFAQCRATENGGNGFDLTANTTVTDCVSVGNTGSGFNAGSTVLLTGCTASSNTYYGFRAVAASVVRGCVATSNETGGISVGNECVISGNSVSGHNDANAGGIDASGTHSRIDDNTLSGNTNGFRVTGTNNLITRNTVSGSNSPWNVEFGNRCHVIFWGPGGGIVGGSGGSLPGGATDPNSNITFQ